jgi:hypothetical protein
MRKPVKIVLGTIAVLALVGIGAAIGSSGASTSAGSPQPRATAFVAGPTVTATVTAKPVAPAVPSKSTMSGDGVFVVGQDITPGTYHTTGAVNGADGNCYYALLGSTDTSNIIDNNNVTGPATITVGPGVKAVDISGCEVWSRE